VVMRAKRLPRLRRAPSEWEKLIRMGNPAAAGAEDFGGAKW